MQIRNVNERYGMDIEFTGGDLPECVHAMASAIVACGEEVANGQSVDDLCYHLREDVDYEIVD